MARMEVRLYDLEMLAFLCNSGIGTVQSPFPQLILLFYWKDDTALLCSGSLRRQDIIRHRVLEF